MSESVDALAPFSPAAREWFASAFAAATPVQRDGWARIAAGEHALLLAPTGSGKTLAAFFYAIDQLGSAPRDGGARGVELLYISPLKALVADIERNLRAPLVGVARAADRIGARFAAPRVALRTGDTPVRDRRTQARDPAEILVTTPESLYLILGSAQRETLRAVRWIVVDEVHALAATKRGAHLALSLERVAALCGEREPQRIGLSATARPVSEVARYLGGSRAVAIVDATGPPRLDLTISVPVPDMTKPGTAARVTLSAREPEVHEIALPGHEASAGSELLAPFKSRAKGAGGEDPDTSLWPAIYPKLLEAIRAHRSTILFVNSRGLCERLARRLNELAEEDLVRAHHGSIAHEQRRAIEEDLKAGRLRAIVATSSLELGIDMGAVDLVLMVESPGAVSRGLQRVGRAGHQVGAASRGLIFPKHRSDLLEATVVAKGMRAGAVESLRVPHTPLDVLAQQIVAITALEGWDVSALHDLLRRSASYADLSRELLGSVLDMLAGRYPSADFAELKPRITWDRERDRIEARPGAGKVALLSGGTIPDRGLYGVHVGADGPRVGELDEEMVHETRAGEIVTLGASSWRVAEITRDRVIVNPAPGELGKLPFWRGDGPGRPLELGRALGAFVRELGEQIGPDAAAGETFRPGQNDRPSRDRAEAWLAAHWDLDAYAARNLVDYVQEQREATGSLPSDRSITIERFRDELGDWRVCILTPFGSRLHGPWALAIQARLAAEKATEVHALWNDDGIALRFPDADEAPPTSLFLPEPEEVRDQVVEQVERSALFSGQFRENAARALLLPRWRPGGRTPLWSQRLRAQTLLGIARGFPSFPILLETYRSCLQDAFDLPALEDLLAQIRRREVRIDDVETRSASPFSRNLVFAYTAAFLYEYDNPVAEKRAHALSLDRAMLRELLGHEELRELLDLAVVEEAEAELCGRAPEFRARAAEQLFDLLRRVGDLSDAEIEERSEGDARAWLETLAAERRVARVRIAGEPRWIAAHEAGLYRDAFGVSPPAGLPAEFLEAAPDAIASVVARFARRRGPFVTGDLASRYGLPLAQAELALASLEARGKLASGDFRPGGAAREWCDADVLQLLRRRSLARLRGEVAPVESRALVRFLPEWQGVASGGSLADALDRLEGVPLPWSELERAVLPARVKSFDPRALDELSALGALVWIGAGALGDRDGRVALYRRERAALLADSPIAPDSLSPLAQSILAQLTARGALFFGELLAASGGASAKDVLDALYELVWAGLATNDTFAPLRSLGTRAPLRRGALPGGAAGRWSSVASVLASAISDTQRAHARAGVLLERYGVLAREAFAQEHWRGGFGGVYPVLRAMEEAGKVRRGHFVAGYQGAQFAYAGAVDRLRAARTPYEANANAAAALLVLAACDPAVPFGTLLPWPTPSSPLARPRRSVGARVALADGVLLAFIERGAKKLWTFRDATEAQPELLARAMRALFADRSLAVVRLEEIDGAPAAESPLAEALLRGGFRRGYRGLELERSAASREI
ncbi:MAG: DEAD/DEAH box helicase [Deltaproteobacteria bacterium]|nr:DEAD/DEAH box helicase [Deltaproteobacteria bacterium]